MKLKFPSHPFSWIGTAKSILTKSITPIALALLLLASCSKEDGEKQQYTLTVEPTPSEGGTVSPSSGSFDAGESVSLRATPSSDHVFKNWTGAVSGTDNPVILTMDGDRSVTAVFEKRQYPLTIAVEGEGIVTESLLSSKTTDYDSGSSVQLTPEPEAGWEFVEWRGDVTGTENPLTLTVDAPTSITAVFRPVLEGLIIGKWDVENNSTGTTGKGDDLAAITGENGCTVFSLVFNLDGTFVLNLSSGQFEGSFAFDSADSITLESTGTMTNVSITSGILTFDLSLPDLCEVQVTAEPDPDYEEGDCVSFLDCNDGKVWKRETEAGMEYIRLTNEVGNIWIELYILDTERECLLSEETNQTGSTFLLKNDIDVLIYVLDDTPKGDIEVTLTLTEDGSLSMARIGQEGADYYTEATEEELTTYLQTYEACPLPLIYLSENGVTIKCRDDAQVGETGEVNGIIYTVVDEATLRQMVADGEDVTKVCTTKVTDMSNLFEGDWENINEFNQDIGSWDVSNVNTMSYMFAHSQFNQDIGSWDVSNVTNMRGIFLNSQFNQEIGNWNVGNVIDMDDMFAFSQFNQDIGSWDVGSVTGMNGMFVLTPFNQDIGKWDVSNVIGMSVMFSRSLFNKDIGNWNTSSVVIMHSMFSFTPFNQDIGNWDVSNVTDMSSMFSNSQFNQDIGDWDVTNVTDMFRMFWETPFNQDIGSWDTSNVTNMRQMFMESQFNQDIGNWDIGSVNSMKNMFLSATSFNQDLSRWDIGNVTDVADCSDFSSNTPQWTLPKPDFPGCKGYLITDLLSENENLQNLVAALSAANGNLPAVLRGDGPFTVLAPTDEAFDTFLDGAALGDIPVDVLTNVLLNHVISGEVASTDLVGLGSGYISTMAIGAGNQMVSLFFDSTDVVIFNGVSSFVTPDIKALNGIVHEVDAVIDIPNIIDHVVANPSLSSFKEILNDFYYTSNFTFTDLLSNEEEQFTIFAPGNDAFGVFTNPNSNDLNAILSNHVVVGSAAFSSDLTNSYVNTAAEFDVDENLSLYINTDDGVTLNGTSNVVMADIVASNGVIHTVDAVIDLPTVVTFAAADPNFSTLLQALTELTPSTDFVSLLSAQDGAGSDPFTVFAPTNDAFAALAAIPAEADLIPVLQHHVVAGVNIRSGDLSDGLMAITLEGAITINLPGTGDNIADITDGAGNSGIGIDELDVQAINGVICTVDTVMIPKQ